MLKAYKYRLYPTVEQALKIDQTIAACRLVYNLALQIRILAYKEHEQRLTYYDLYKDISGLRDDYKWIHDVNSQALYNSVKTTDRSFVNFFKGAGFPKFKSKRNGGSFTCHNNTRRIDFESSTLTVPKINGIRVKVSRTFVGKIKTITISKTNTEKYFASIVFETSDIPHAPKEKKAAIGVDLGLIDFATLSTGEKISNPKFLHRDLQRLKVLQRRVSKKKKGSANRLKAWRSVFVMNEKILNKRIDFLHKLSTRLISDSQTDTICVEDLNVVGMRQNRKLSKAISDVSWAEFIRQLEYKGKWYGKNVVKVKRFFASSKICSNCSYKKEELGLSEREWVCENCGITHDRDINAAINIRNSGMGSPGEPVELPSIDGAMKQESMSNLNRRN